MKKKKKKQYNYVLGIDIGGATRMGVALTDNNTKRLIYYSSIKRRDVKNNLEHRMNLVNEIRNILNKYPVDIILIESIRLFSYGRIQMSTILSLQKVHTTLVNEFSNIVDIYQIDVRSWKAKVLGNGNADKNESIRYVQNKYPEIELIDEIVKPIKKEIVLELNADLADAICISESLKFDDSILKNTNKLNYT